MQNLRNGLQLDVRDDAFAAFDSGNGTAADIDYHGFQLFRKLFLRQVRRQPPIPDIPTGDVHPRGGRFILNSLHFFHRRVLVLDIVCEGLADHIPLHFITIFYHLSDVGVNDGRRATVKMNDKKKNRRLTRTVFLLSPLR